MEEIIDFQKLYLSDLIHSNSNHSLIQELSLVDLERELARDPVKAPSLTRKFLGKIAQQIENYNKIFLDFLGVLEEQQTEFLDMKLLSKNMSGSDSKNGSMLSPFASNYSFNKFAVAPRRQIMESYQQDNLLLQPEQDKLLLNRSIIASEQSSIYFQIISKKFIRVQDHFEYKFTFQTCDSGQEQWHI